MCRATSGGAYKPRHQEAETMCAGVRAVTHLLFGGLVDALDQVREVCSLPLF